MPNGLFLAGSLGKGFMIGQHLPGAARAVLTHHRRLSPPIILT
jgi:hypothetical protein